MGGLIAQRGWCPLALVRAMRPSQWTKNGVVLAAYFFARWDPSQQGNAAGWGALISALAEHPQLRTLHRPANLEDLCHKLTGRQNREDA